MFVFPVILVTNPENRLSVQDLFSAGLSHEDETGKTKYNFQKFKSEVPRHSGWDWGWGWGRREDEGRIDPAEEELAEAERLYRQERSMSKTAEFELKLAAPRRQRSKSPGPRTRIQDEEGEKQEYQDRTKTI